MALEKFIPPHPLDTAVLFLVFNRPDTTRQVFEAIRKAKIPRLYIAADGPRTEIPGEAEKVREVRNLVIDNVDWDCSVKTLFRDNNIGCRDAVSGGISWFFENEEQGIILEDDILPSQSFFWFCEELLERYKYDDRIFSVAASHFQNQEQNLFEDSYFVSKYSMMWGWATWRKKWQKFSLDIDDYKKIILKDKDFDFMEKIYWLSLFGKIRRKQIDTIWDYHWMLSCWRNQAYSIRPAVNLSKNIGFHSDATHTKTVNETLASLKQDEIDLMYLKHFSNLSYQRCNDASTRKVWASVGIKRILLINFPSLIKWKSILTSRFGY